MQFPGYRVFSQLFEPDLIESARHSVNELCRILHPNDPRWETHVCPLSALKEHRNPGLAAQSLTDIPFLLSGLPVLSPVLANLILHEPLWHAARDVLERDDIIYHFSNVTRKPAQIGPNISWHRDYPNEFICPRRSDHFFRLLIPLEGMNEENGCTLAVPDTHHLSDDEALLKPTGEDISNALPLDLSAGDAVAIHPKLLHGGRENRSARERNLIVIQFGIPTSDHLYQWNEPLTGSSREEILSQLTA